MFNLLKPEVPRSPFDEQDMLMGMLRNDPRIMSHVWGAQIYDLQRIERDEDKAHELINDILVDIGQRFADDPETVSRILRTMMVNYYVGIEVTKVPAFDRIHGIIAHYVDQNHPHIEVYQ